MTQMRTLKKGFSPRWYDFYDDWDLIEASLAQQYGLRIRSVIDTISWSEVKMLIAGLMSDTPLGNIIQIRSENDNDTLKSFTPDMHKIRNEWRNRQAQDKLKNEEVLEQTFENMERMLEVLFG